MPAQHSYKTDLKVEDSPGAGTFTSVAETIEITGPDGAAVVLDVTALQSDFVTKLPGLPDAGSYTATFNQDLNSAQQTLLRNNWSAGPGTSIKLQVIYPTPGAVGTPKLTREFDAKILSWNVTGTQNTQLTVAAGILVLGGINDTLA